MAATAPASSMPAPTVAPADGDGDGDSDLHFVAGQGSAVAENRATAGTGCGGAAVPVLRSGAPYPGNAGFVLRLDGGAPGAYAAIALALSTCSPPGPCGQLLVDPFPPALAVPLTTDAMGAAVLLLPIPADPVLTGLTVLGQGAVYDTTAPFDAAITALRTFVCY